MSRALSPTNGFHVYGWMRTEFDLKGAELFTYALIHQFSQSDAGFYKGGVNYLASWLGCSYNSASKYLKALVAKRLIVEIPGIENNVRYCHYTLNFEVLPQILGEGSPNFEEGGSPNFGDRIEYKNRNRIENIPPYISKDIYSPNEKKSAKKRNPKEKKEYAEGVRLTEEEYGRLCQEYGRERADAAISYLSSYKIEKDYKTKDDNLTLRRWVFKAVDRDSMEIQKAGGTKKRSRLDDLQDTFDQIDRMFDGAQFTDGGKFIDEQ